MLIIGCKIKLVRPCASRNRSRSLWLSSSIFRYRHEYTSSRLLVVVLIDDLNFRIHFGQALRRVKNCFVPLLHQVCFSFSAPCHSPASFLYKARYYCGLLCRSSRCPMDRKAAKIYKKKKKKKKKKKGIRNDFEIFVATHKFGGGGLAYLNMDRTFCSTAFFS